MKNFCHVIFGELLLSSQSFRKKTRITLTNLDLKFIQSSNNKNRIHGEEYLNSPNNCKACECDCSYDIITRRKIPLIKHHVSYFPEKIVFVHCECHFAIHHKGIKPDLIQYNEGDSRKFYELEKKNRRENLGGITA